MLLTKARPFISGALLDAVPTSVDAASPIMHGDGPESRAYEAWQRVVDQLIEWGRDSGQLEDEGLDPPSSKNIQRAIDFVRQVQKRGVPPPTSVYPDPNAGIVLERRQKDVSEKYHFWEDGSVEYFRVPAWLNVGPCSYSCERCVPRNRHGGWERACIGQRTFVPADFRSFGLVLPRDRAEGRGLRSAQDQRWDRPFGKSCQIQIC
jgi:hypothetical protein